MADIKAFDIVIHFRHTSPNLYGVRQCICVVTSFLSPVYDNMLDIMTYFILCMLFFGKRAY